MQRMQLIYNFLAARSALKKAKAIELRWRLQLAMLFDDPHLGTNTLGSIKLICAQTYTLDKDEDKIVQAMEEVSVILSDDVSIDEVIKWKPVITQAAYEALPDDAKKLLQDVLTIKPALAQIRIAGAKDDTE